MAQFGILKKLSVGEYNNENIRILFRQGLQNGHLGVAAHEIVARDILSTLIKAPQALPGVYWIGVSMSPADLNIIKSIGKIQNFGISFFSNNEEIAKYFATTENRIQMPL